jgi:hypothetical protein
MKISTALEEIREHQLFVPAFQCEYGVMAMKMSADL